MTPEAAREAAALLRAARRCCQPLDALPERCRPTTMAEAYAIQAAFVAGPAAEDEALLPCGFKLACTSPKAQQALGSDGPFYGRLICDGIFDSPHAQAAAPFLFRLVEPEFVLCLAEDLPKRNRPYEEDEVAEAVECLFPAIEIVTSAYGESWWHAGAEALAADNAVHGFLVLGTPRPDWRDLDLPGHSVHLTINGETVGRGQGANALGGPVTALTWLANSLRKAEDGPALAAGDLVTTGVVTDFEMMQAGDSACADFGELGRVELRFTP